MIDTCLIKVDQKFTTQEEVFKELANLVVEAGYAKDEASVFQALQKRESEGTTGMMDGYAIPHAKSLAIEKPAIAVLKLSQGVEWNAMDAQPIRYVLALFIPENEAGTTHLQMLSKLARLLMRKEFKEAFEGAESREALKELLEKELN